MVRIRCCSKAENGRPQITLQPALASLRSKRPARPSVHLSRHAGDHVRLCPPHFAISEASTDTTERIERPSWQEDSWHRPSDITSAKFFFFFKFFFCLQFSHSVSMSHLLCCRK
ncbi:hypothetical protein CORC01_09356 [Colletotrichum orchidophilum]|uniref:Uncharacterized protein n=1 Tax=Colletotrichum orchidophilum TaxID=1209926 RepID=A0A1G4B1Z3_9PEZI|nr:uncharacterized protein CORC01_09356 [Colletotrichum orchidophilum]OHE95345.1 hypothetical protein CORC01_09356 [Colletotrichum orchidophilum]